MGRKNPTPRRAPEICPVCGEDVPRGAPACPECGADHNSGWREDAESYDSIGLPDDAFNDGHHMLARGAEAFTDRLGREVVAPILGGKP